MDLRRQAFKFREGSIKDSTKRARLIQWKCYLGVCEQYSWTPLPCDRDQACLYVTALSGHLSYLSILTYYQAVVYVHVCNGLDPVRLSDPVLKATLAGVERSKAGHKVGKDPMLPVHLVKIAKVVNLCDDLEMLVFIAMLLLFRTLLRVSHVVRSQHSLKRGDVKFNSEGCLVAIHSSKTSKSNGEVVYLPVVSGADPKICAVRWLKQLLIKFPGSSGDLLFSTKEKSGLSYGMFSSRFRKLVERAGLSGDFASHSLRKGGATFMSMSGCGLTEVKDRGGWKSDCVYRYR